MKRIALILGVVLAFLGTPAHAATGPYGHWTQLYNGNYPADSSNPNCGPCQKWVQQHYNGTYRSFISAASWVNNDLDGAVQGWSGQPYRSPVFNKSTSNYEVAYTVAALRSDMCGSTGLSTYSDGSIYAGTVYLSSSKAYYDGTGPSGCDLRWTFFHETGHVFSEGHSSLGNATMSPADSGIEQVDSYAKAELNAVYGPVGSGGGGGAQPSPSLLKQSLRALSLKTLGTPTHKVTTL